MTYQKKNQKSTTMENDQNVYQNDPQITEFYQNHLDDMLNRHSKVFQTRIDLHLPADQSVDENPKQIRDFTEYLSRDLKRNYPLPKEGRKRSEGHSRQTHSTDPRVIWAREKHNDSPHSHFHSVVLVNGHSKKSGYDIHQRAIRQWANALGLEKEKAKPLVHYCNDNGPATIMIDKNSSDYHDAVQAAKKQAGYLAKTKGKENTPKHHWKAGGTRFKKN